MIIEGKNISYSFEFDGNDIPALDDVSLSIEKGELIVILGCNGSGKTTLVRHLNALLAIQHGELQVAQINVKNEAEIWQLRRLCGMLFQNPENQFVSSIIEEDVAFGLKNYQVPESEIAARVEKALQLTGLSGYEKRSPHSLSGGQKQRAALAGILAIDPDILIFDEATAMLDPQGRREVLAMADNLHKAGKTILMITHYVEEAINADRILLMHAGQMLASGTPGQILTDQNLMQEAELIPPPSVRMYYDLMAAGVQLRACPLTIEELAEEICRLI